MSFERAKNDTVDYDMLEEARRASDLMDEVFELCTNSKLEPEVVCVVMIQTFQRSLFTGLCYEHAKQIVEQCYEQVLTEFEEERTLQ